MCVAADCFVACCANLAKECWWCSGHSAALLFLHMLRTAATAFPYTLFSAVDSLLHQLPSIVFADESCFCLCRPLASRSACCPLLLLSSCTHQQTKEGKVAQGVTSMEWTEIAGKIKDKAYSPENKLLLGRNEEWLFSWDNDKVHKGADLSEVGIEPEDRYYLPELSSDMHKVVENVHAWLQEKMQAWLEQQDKATLRVDACKQQLEHFFYNELPTESIRKNVDSLPDTYEAIVLNNGGYLTKKRR